MFFRWVISREIVKKILYNILFKQQVIDLVWFPLKSCALTWLIGSWENRSPWLTTPLAWGLAASSRGLSKVRHGRRLPGVTCCNRINHYLTCDSLSLIEGNVPSSPLRWFSVFLSCEPVWPWNCSWFWWSRMGGTLIALITTSIWMRVSGLWKYSNYLTLFGCPSNAMLQISQVILCIHLFYRSRQCMRDMANFIAEYWGAEIRTEIPDL